MAFYNWNNDEKKDWQDDYLEYEIYNASTEDNNSFSSSGESSGWGCLGWVFILIILAAIFK